MDFIVLTMTMVLSVALSAAAARVVLDLVLQVLWRSIERPRVERVAADAGLIVLTAQLSPIRANHT